VNSIWVSGEGEHGVRPYANLVGASDPSPVAIQARQVPVLDQEAIPPVRCMVGIKTGAGLGSRTLVVALPSRLVSLEIRTRVLL
jgi:hypothetical protein